MQLSEIAIKLVIVLSSSPRSAFLFTNLDLCIELLVAKLSYVPMGIYMWQMWIVWMSKNIIVNYLLKSLSGRSCRLFRSL